EIEISHHRLVRVYRKRLGRTARTSAGHYIDEIENRERLNDSKYQRNEDEARKERPRDQPEFCPAAAAIDFHCFVKIIGNGLKTREENHEYKWCRLPGVGDDECPEGRRWIAQPRYRRRENAGAEQQAVEDPVLIIEDPPPQHRYHSSRQRPRDQQNCSDCTSGSRPRVHGYGKHQAR